MKVYKFDELETCDLIIDAIYEGGNMGNVSDDPINKILPVGNLGGFRYAGKIDSLKYIVLYTSGEDLDWPNTIDKETGIFQYYGDNKKPGYDLHETKKKGNLILKNTFEAIHSDNKARLNVPPIFIFLKYPTANSNRSVQFKGLCVPGVNGKNQTEDLVAIWKTTNGLRFQNYLAYFTILDIAIIQRSWLSELNKSIIESRYIPEVFSNWRSKGILKPLISKKTIEIRTVPEQLPSNSKEWSFLNFIYKTFKDQPLKFEYFAAEIFKMTDSRIIIDEITRGSVDGGRDAIGRYKIGLNNDPIFTEFALEAKCYNPGLNEKPNLVKVREVARLISRIRNRQFGVLVNTSAVHRQAYKEVRQDGHPIIFISGKDIIQILLKNGFNDIKSIKGLIDECISKYS